jgi:four helix bundle protein
VVVKKLEDLIAFQQAIAFRNEVYAIVRKHPEAYHAYRYRDQLFDAAESVGANLAEGWRRGTDPDKIRFMRYASGSLEEARVRLLAGIDRGFFDRTVCDNALRHAVRCSRATARFIESLEIGKK